MSKQAIPDRVQVHGEPSTTGVVTVGEADNQREVLPIQVKAANVVALLGGPTEAARWLHVSRSQPSRWVKGSELPSPASTRVVIDVDYIFSRLLQVYERDTALTWMRSPNAYLDGASPRTVLREQGPARVVEAIDATLSGSYA